MLKKFIKKSMRITLQVTVIKLGWIITARLWFLYEITFYVEKVYKKSMRIMLQVTVIKLGWIITARLWFLYVLETKVFIEYHVPNIT